MVEQWKDIIGYEGIYQISNYGKIRNNKKQFIKQFPNKKGYLRVSLFKYGKRKNAMVHRLVADAFIPNKNNLSQVNHIDENKTNNKIDNLEWCNNLYNCNYGSHTKKRCQYSLDGKLIKVWNSASQIKRELGLNEWYILKCCKGTKKQYGGYIWKYLTN